MATPVLRFGIIGLGIASTQILPEFHHRPHLRVTAAADPRPQALEKFKREFGGKVFTEGLDLCRSPDVDAVYICSPNHLHAMHAIAAAESGKHIIVEKPMALTLDQCEAMNAAAAKAGVRLLCGHTHSFDPPILAMRQLVREERWGRLRMISTWHFNEFMYRPRMPHELDPTQGGNLIYNQGPHQVDIVRLLGGGLVRSVRAATYVFDPARRAQGAYAAFLAFADGTAATLVYNGYGHWDSSEFTDWVGEQPRARDYNWRVRQQLKAAGGPEGEWQLKEAERYGGARQRPLRSHDGPHPIFGLTVASCERADIRQSPQGLLIYTDEDRRELFVPKGLRGRAAELEELYRAVVEDRPVRHDGRWGEATLEVVLAIGESARLGQEVQLRHQVPVWEPEEVVL